MRSLAVTLLVLLAVALASAGAWFLFADGSSTGRVELSDDVEPIADESTPVVPTPVHVQPGREEQVAIPSTLDIPPLAEGFAQVVGKVVTPEGESILDATVALVWAGASDDPPAELTGEAPAAVPSGPDGVFLTPAVPALPGWRLEVAAPRRQSVRRGLHLIAGETYQAGVIPLPDSGRIAGKVLTVDQARVPFASVTLDQDRTVTADEHGAFEFEGLGPGEYWLRAEADALAALPGPPVRLGLGQQQDDVLVRMTAGHTLAGQVLGPDQEPVEGAQVFARMLQFDDFERRDLARDIPAPETPSVVTDAAGRFQVGPLAAGHVWLHASHPAHRDRSETFDVPGPEVTLNLSHSMLAFGRVIDASRRPLRTSRVSVLRSPDGEQGPWYSYGAPVTLDAETAARGEFRVPVRSQRTLRLLVEGPEFARVLSEPFRLENDESHGPLILVAGEGTRLHGQVIDSSGRPQAGARVRVQERQDSFSLSWRRGFDYAPVTSALDGTFETPPLPPGRYDLSAWRRGSFPSEVETVEFERPVDLGPVQLVLREAGQIAGRVRHETGGTIPRLRIAAVREDVEGGDPEEEAEEGTSADRRLDGTEFELGPLAPGVYRVTLTRGGERRRGPREFDVSASSLGVLRELGYPEGPEPEEEATVVADLAGVVVKEGETTWIELEVGAEVQGGVQGTLYLNGAPAPLAMVTLGPARDLDALSCITDPAGRYRFEAVGGSELFLGGSPSSRLQPFGQVPVSVPPGRLVTQDLYLETGRLSGTVHRTDSDRPLSGARVRVELATYQPGLPEYRGVTSVNTGEDGRYELADVPAGQVLVTASLRYFETLQRAPVVVTAGQTARRDIELPAVGLVTVYLMGTEGERLRDAFELELTPKRGGDPEEVVRRSVAQGPGRVTLEMRAEGRYRVRVSVPSSGREYLGEVDVKLGSSRTVRARL